MGATVGGARGRVLPLLFWRICEKDNSNIGNPERIWNVIDPLGNAVKLEQTFLAAKQGLRY